MLLVPWFTGPLPYHAEESTSILSRRRHRNPSTLQLGSDVWWRVVRVDQSDIRASLLHHLHVRYKRRPSIPLHLHKVEEYYGPGVLRAVCRPRRMGSDSNPHDGVITGFHPYVYRRHGVPTR